MGWWWLRIPGRGRARINIKIILTSLTKVRDLTFVSFMHGLPIVTHVLFSARSFLLCREHIRYHQLFPQIRHPCLVHFPMDCHIPLHRLLPHTGLHAPAKSRNEVNRAAEPLVARWWRMGLVAAL